MKKCLLFCIIALLILSYFSSGAADTASDITGDCRLSSTDKEKKAKVLTDDSYLSCVSLDADGYIQVEPQNGVICGGIYIQFLDVPAPYSVQWQKPDGSWEIIAHPDASIVNMYVSVGDRSGIFRIVATQATRIAEVRVIGAGKLPDWVQTWKHMDGKADLMLVVAHPDDELVFLGGTLPYYCGQLHKKTIMVYMTTGWTRRRNELLDGLWLCGVRDYPELCEFPDSYTQSGSWALSHWGGRDFVYQKVASLIRRYQPDVVISQDIINGETKHGMHFAVAEATVNAVELAANSTYDTATAEAFGVWQVKKLYLHLYNQNKIVMPWDTMELSEFGGKTAAEVAQEAFDKHVSQQETAHKVYLSGSYNSKKFGLYFSTVGPDEAGNDFFEHIDID